MQTSLQRRQRHRRNGAARRGRGAGTGRGLALAIPVFLFSSFLVLGVVGFVGAVSAYAYYSRDLPDPKDLFANLGFDQPSVIYDKTGTVELARLGERKRELATFDDLSPEVLDATTSIEDKDFWTNPGFDLGGFISATLDTLQGRPRGGSTITQQLVRARLLPSEVVSMSDFERKPREIIQSIRLTQAYPGDEGKKQIITAYLNQNFYGNQSYGIKAAAQGYFGKDLKDLTLAQAAILAGIPQSPSRYDLMQNAIRECSVTVAEGEDCPADKTVLVVPDDSEIVQRRNRILQLMETRSVLSAGKHTTAEYEAAMKEKVVLVAPTVARWKAAHFVWQVRRQLGQILCGSDNADSCEKVDTGGYRIITTLDWKMQQTVEKWTAAATRAPNTKDTRGALKKLGIPESEWGWILNLRGGQIHNAAAAIIDYRTGQVLAYVGSAGYYSTGDKKFQPQFDVMGAGFRQPGSAIKPLNYITGIEDKTLTAATMFMDVVTDFGTKSKSFTPTQSDKRERGPVRLRSALQYSLNVPSIKAGLINGLAHVLQREKDFGLTYQKGIQPVVSQSIGTLETHPIDLLGAYGAIADGGILMPRTFILEVRGPTGDTVYPNPETQPTGRRVASQQASYIITDILAGNTIKSVNPDWGKWQILDGKKRRPAAYKTGTTSDNKDVLAYGYLAPPDDPKAPALAVGVWMGNSDSTPNSGSLSLDSSAPLWSRILTEASKGTPITDFKRPSGIVEATVDAFSGLLPGPYTVATVKEVFIDGTVPTRKDDLHVELDIDQATGLLWADGCTGPMVTQAFLDFSKVEARFPGWKPFTQEWAARAARGAGVVGGPERTRTSYFYNNSFTPFGKTWGGKFAPTEVCAPVVPATCPPDGVSPYPSFIVPCITPPPPTETPKPTGNGNGKPTPTPILPGPTPGPTKKPRRGRRRIPTPA
jgi:membrane peptidoglycan carboxypeptidase